jgi:hypothetical protein
MRFLDEFHFPTLEEAQKFYNSRQGTYSCLLICPVGGCYFYTVEIFK